MIRRLFPVLLLTFLSCSTEPPALTESGTTDYLPRGADTVLQIPSYRKAIVEGFTMAAHLFGRESTAELQRKIFRILSSQWRLPLLRPEALIRMGAAPDRPVLLAGFGGGAFYASIPITGIDEARKTVQRLFPKLPPASKEGRLLITGSPDAKIRFIMSKNRLYVLYRIRKKTVQKGAWPATLFKNTRNSFRAWLSARTVQRNSLPLIGSAGSSILVRYARTHGRIRLHTTIFSKHFPPVFTGLLPAAKKITTNLFTWKRYGRFPSAAVAPGDLLFLSFSISPEILWKSYLYPAIRKKVVTRIGGIGFLMTRFFRPGQSPVDKAINRYRIREDILNRLTGRIAVRLRGLSGIPLSRSMDGILDAGQLSLMLEAKSPSEAQKIILKLAALMKIFRIRMQEWGEKDFTWYELPMQRLGMMRYLYISRMGRVLTLSFRKDEVLGANNSRFPNRGGKAQAGGSLSGILDRSRLRCWLSLSISKTVLIISRFLDWNTRSNLGPLTGQLAKLSRINLTMSRKGGFPLLSTEFRLRDTPAASDPFLTAVDETDILLYSLGGFFLFLIVLVIFRYLYKKIRYRN